MPESFGARLRQRRERQQIDLTAVAERTKIKLSLLEGLERDDVSRWPAGIFRRAFVRAYADAIALEPDVTVREFLENYPEPTEAVTTEPAMLQGGDEAGAAAGPPTRLRCLVSSAVSSLSRLRWGGVARPPAGAEPDLLAAAHLCVELGRFDETRDVAPLLHQAAGILDAVGLIVWVWQPKTGELRPTLAQGYSEQVLGQLPKVGRDADNATASAFRSTRTCVVNGRNLTNGAVVVPLMTPGGCVGVLAIELQHGREQLQSVRALATIFAAQLARVIGAARSAEDAKRKRA
ncbi:MAG: helix-turn-helix domain-containing protein [Acidobacteriota bacterium]